MFIHQFINKIDEKQNKCIVCMYVCMYERTNDTNDDTLCVVDPNKLSSG